MRNVILCLLGVCFLFTDLLNAQETIKLDEITVTSSRLQSEPISYLENAGNVSIINSDDIETRQYENLQQALFQNVPGIFMRDGIGNSELADFGLRTFNPGQNNVSRQLILLDGVRLADPESNSSYAQLNLIDMDNVERIEVYRGGISSIYGFNAGAGVVNIITRHIKAQDSFSGNISVGSYNYSNVNLLFNSSIKDLYYSINLSKTKSEDFRENNLGNEQGFDKWNADMKLMYNFKKSAVTVKIDHFDGDFASPGSLTPDELKQNRFQVSDRDEQDYFKNKMNMYSLNYKADVLGDWNWNSDFSFRKEEQETFSEDSSHNEKITNRNIDIMTLTSQLNNTVAIAGIKNNIFTGIEFSDNDIELIVDILKGFSKDSNRKVDNKQTGLFFQDKIEISDKLYFLTGLRYDKTEFNIKINETGYPEAELEPSFDGINSKFLLNYTFLKKCSVFAGYSKSYSHPNSFSYLPDPSWAVFGMVSNADLKSEKQKEVNTGFRYADKKMLVEISCFRIIQEDPIVLNSTWTKNVNEGEIERKGIEFYLLSKLPYDLDLIINSSLNEAKYTKIMGSTGAAVGDNVPETPKFLAGLSLIKRLSEKIKLQLNAEHVGKQYINSDNNNSSPMLDDYTLLNMSIDAEINENFKLVCSLNNITNTKYLTWALEDFMKPGISYCVPGAPAEIKVGLKIKF